MACSDTPNSFKRLDTEETPESDVKKEIVVQQKEAGAASTEPRTKDEAWCHDEFPPLQDAVHITYCPRCGFPPDFCDFGRCWTECQSYALEHYPQYYTHSLKQRGVSAEPARATQKPPQDSTSSSTLPSTASALPAVTKSKKKGSAPVVVTIQRVSRAKHKMATVVYGVDQFGIKLDHAAKLFKKYFACGSSAVKGLPGQQDHIEIQGDFEWEVETLLKTRFQEIPADAIVHLKPK